MSIAIEHKGSNFHGHRLLYECVNAKRRWLALFTRNRRYLAHKIKIKATSFTKSKPTLYSSNSLLFKKARISSNLRFNNVSSFFFSSWILKLKIASMPFARQLS